MSPDGKQAGQETNDSPAFRLRPRMEPKSYYTIRLEYSANPAAFTRVRARSSKRKLMSSSHRSSYSRSKNQSGNSRSTAASTTLQNALLNNRYPNGQPFEQAQHIVTKEDLEREERRKQLQREVAQSITRDTPMSPFIQRLRLDELKPDTIYTHNYITLRVKSIENKNCNDLGNGCDTASKGHNSDDKCLICNCSSVDVVPSLAPGFESPNALDKPNLIYLDVHLFNLYADETLIKVDKIINVGKFKTGPVKTKCDQQGLNDDDKSDRFKHLNFSVIVNYDSLSISQTSNESNRQRRPLIPFVSVTDMIEEPTDPYVETMPSPVSSPKIEH